MDTLARQRKHYHKDYKGNVRSSSIEIMKKKNKPSKQQFLGAVLFSLSVLGMWFIRYEARNDGHHYLWGWSIICPVVFIISLAAIIFPGPRTERKRRGEDVYGMAGLHIITRRWWKVFIVAVLFGALHYWYWYVWKYFFLWRNVH